MRKIFTISLGVLLLSSCGKPKKYCGKVVKAFHTGAGYKVSAEPHVQFYCDSLKRIIDVETTWNSYANITAGKNVCFYLHDVQLRQ